jgi:hypothetical protein
MDRTHAEMTPAVIAILVGAYLIVFLLVGIFFAIGNYHLARRLGKNRALWVILTLIPGVNLVFYYVFYQVIYGVLDRLPLHPLPRDRV